MRLSAMRVVWTAGSGVGWKGPFASGPDGVTIPRPHVPTLPDVVPEGRGGAYSVQPVGFEAAALGPVDLVVFVLGNVQNQRSCPAAALRLHIKAGGNGCWSIALPVHECMLRQSGCAKVKPYELELVSTFVRDTYVTVRDTCVTGWAGWQPRLGCSSGQLWVPNEGVEEWLIAYTGTYEVMIDSATPKNSLLCYQ